MSEAKTEENTFLQLNLAAFKQYYPEIYSSIKEDIQPFSISHSSKDNSILNIFNNKSELTISDSQRQSEVSKISNSEVNDPVYFVSGIGVGDELIKIFGITQFPIPELINFKLPIYVLEPDPRMLISSMQLHDMRELFESRRVIFFIGNTRAK